MQPEDSSLVPSPPSIYDLLPTLNFIVVRPDIASGLLQLPLFSIGTFAPGKNTSRRNCGRKSQLVSCPGLSVSGKQTEIHW